MLKKFVVGIFLVIISVNADASELVNKYERSYLLEDFDVYAQQLYSKLNDADLSYEAFQLGLKGYLKLRDDEQINSDRFLTIIDMSRSANLKRFFLIDLKDEKIVHKSIVAHGRNSGGEYAKLFSNKVGSYKSSIGFYRTAETYRGKHGLSLRLDGLENSNSNARKRAIVIHAADYVSEHFIRNNGRLGRSLGCPSLPEKDYDKIIGKIKDGSLLFIYYPEENYLRNSSLVNLNPASAAEETSLTVQ